MLVARRSVQPTVADTRRQQVLRAARSFAGAIDRRRPLRSAGYTFDPNTVGLVQAAFWSAGIDVFDAPLLNDNPTTGGLELIYRSANKRRQLHRRTPQRGDLVFFDDFPVGYSHTKGPTSLFPSQVAIVSSVAPDGTISAVGIFADGLEKISLNLRDSSKNRRHNTLLLAHRKWLPARALFRSFADPFH